MPDRLSSTCAFSSPSSWRDSLKLRRMRLANRFEKNTISGSTANMISVSVTLLPQRMMNAATILMPAISTSSGMWWANSVMSFRSVVMRLISWPVLALSKKSVLSA